MIEIFKDKKLGFRFRVKARNGKIIAQSESYKNRKGCENGIKSLITNCQSFNVKVKDLTQGA